MKTRTTAHDDELGQRLRAGCPEAFTAVLQDHQAGVYNLALRMTGARDEAADVTQLAFLRLWQKREDLRPGRPVKPWLYRIATNLCIDHCRRQRGRRTQRGDGLEAESASILPGGEPTHAAEVRRLVQGALEELSPGTRVMVLMHCVLGHTLAEIAAARGVSRNIVKERLRQGKRTLRRRLAHLRP